MELIEIDNETAFKILKKHSRCDNYLDSLLSQTDEYLANYLFFTNNTEDVFGISPEKNVHLYSENNSSILDFKNKLSNLSINPDVIFSYLQNDSIIKGSFSTRPLISKPFFYLKKTPNAQVVSNNSNIRLATQDDQELVNFWYKSFNEEEASNWETPQLLSNPEIKLYLLIQNDILLGAAANTLISDSRLWIGRLWVRPDCRKHGFAGELMSHLETVAVKTKKEVSLLVSNHNVKALNLYEKMDYKKISTNCFWY